MKPHGYQKNLVQPAKITAPELPLSSQTPILWPAGCPASCRAADKAPTGTEPSPPIELQS